MKGLLKNNLYATIPNAKVFSIFMFLLGTFVVAVTSQQLVIGYMMVGIIGFSVNAMGVVRNEFVSKWGKYKLTGPVKRVDIVKSYFINMIIWLLVGTLFAGTALGLSWLLHGCPFDLPTDVLTLFALGIDLVIITTINEMLEPGMYTVLLGVGVLIVCSLLAYSISYPITVGIFRRKEY